MGGRHKIAVPLGPSNLPSRDTWISSPKHIDPNLHECHQHTNFIPTPIFTWSHSWHWLASTSPLRQRLMSTTCQAHSVPHILQRTIGLGGEATQPRCLFHCPQVRFFSTAPCLSCHWLLAWHGYSNNRFTCHPGTLLALPSSL